MKATRIHALAACLALCLCLPVSAAETALPDVRPYPGFADVPAGAWYEDAVKICYETGLMNGTSDAAFSPDDPVNLAQVVVLAARAESLLHGSSITPLPLPDDRAQFLDAAGNPVAAFENWKGVSSAKSDGYAVFLYFDEKTTQRLAGTSMVLALDGYRYSTGSYYTLDDRAGWLFPLTKEEFYNRDPFGILMAISNSDYSDIWYAPELFHLFSMDQDRLGALMESMPAFQGDGTQALTTAATRKDFFQFLDFVLRAEDLPALREISGPPDTDDPAVLRFYAAGILNGTDAQGTFRGADPLTRGQAAVMLARVLDPSLRVK